MCNNSLIYMITPTTASVTSGGVLPLSTIARRRGRSISSETDSVLLGAPGYYRVSANVTFTAPVAGDVSIELRNNGTPVAGVTSSTTITTADTEVRSLTLSGIVRVPCCGGTATLSLVNTGVAIETSNISFDVEYLD